MPPNSISRIRVTRVPGGEDGDVVAVEEPLEIRIGGVPVAVTMRTPGHDEELALGFCLAEGLSPLGARVPDDLAANTIDVEAPGADVGALQRNFYTSSSCGVCGKGALEAVAVEAARVESTLTAPASLVVCSRNDASRAGRVRGHRRLARNRPLLEPRRAALRSRGRRPAQRPRQGDRSRLPRRPAALVGCHPLRQRQALVRARAEGRGCGMPVARRRRRAVVARRRARRRSRDHVVRLRPRRLAQRLHDLGGSRSDGRLARRRASTRCRAPPKALARFGGETLAERAWRILGEAFDARLAVGKGDLELPFPVVVEPAEPQAPLVGVIAGLRAAATDTVVFLPVDCPLVTAALLRELGDRGAVTQTGPLPGAYSKRDLPELERRLASADWSLRGVNPRVPGSGPTFGREREHSPRSSQRSNEISPLSTTTSPDSVATSEPPVARDQLRRARDPVEG
jgi:molybdopterin-guanine dinucleotide biosynthesis protein A